MAALNCSADAGHTVTTLERDWMPLTPIQPCLDPPSTSNDNKAGVPAAPPGKNSIVALVAGPFAAQVSQIWSGDRLKEYLTATDARRHVWHAWLASEAMAFHVRNPMTVELAYSRLTFAKGKDLILQAYACQPAGMIRTLGRLGTQARPPEIYRALVRALDMEGPGAKLLRHTSDLSDELILGVAALPAGLNVKPVLDLFKAGRIGFESIGFFTWTIARLEMLKGFRIVQSILSAPKPMEMMWMALQDFPFPRPPWPGDERLRPITTRLDLHRVAADFKNCLTTDQRQREAVLRVLNGSRYFYEWCGPEPALLEFCRIGPVGWYLVQARGRRNRNVPDQERDEILRRLSVAPSLCPTWNWYSHYDEDLTYLLAGLDE
jgi:hypothetical protein